MSVPPHPRLTPGLQEVMELMAEGVYGYGEIAAALGLSEYGARNRRDRACRAMGCETDHFRATAKYVEWRTRVLLAARPVRRHRAPQTESLELA